MIAKVRVSVTVKTVFPDASPVYPDGAVLPPTTVKNVEYIEYYFEILCSVINTVQDFKYKEYIRLQNFHIYFI